MKITGKIMVAAHKMAKEIKAEFEDVNYSFQLGLCITYLAKEGVNEMEEVIMAELIGSEKQIVWAEKIRINMLEGMRILDIFKSNEKIMASSTAVKAVVALEILKNEINTQESAKWFIENRQLVNNCEVLGYSKEIQILSAEHIVYNSKEITSLLKLEDKFCSVICKMKEKVKYEFYELYR